jgi:hypothetical protein
MNLNNQEDNSKNREEGVEEGEDRNSGEINSGEKVESEKYEELEEDLSDNVDIRSKEDSFSESVK